MEKWLPRFTSTDKDKSHIIYYARMFNIHPVTSYLIYARGHRSQESIRRFLYPSFNFFSSPLSLKDMKKGVVRVHKALETGEKIAIFGDYDADGITSTSMMTHALRFLGAEPIAVLPERKEGYGLSKQAVERFQAQGVSLIITVDNGSSCREEVRYAKKMGIDTVVTDHHDILGDYPDSAAFINPKREDDTSGMDYLAGAGVTFFFIQALFESHLLPWDVYVHDYIELATIGTVCDMVPLMDANRALCDMGFKKMNMNPSPSIAFLKRMLYLNEIDSNSLAFDIGPLLNGFGRYDNPNVLVPFLATHQWDNWFEQKCVALQRNRKKIGREQLLLAENVFDQNHLEQYDILHVHGDFHEGILGVLASKFAKKYKKPTLISCENGKGSARSIPNSTYSIIDLLKTQEQYFEKFGGHQFAAGFTIKKGQADNLFNSLKRVQVNRLCMEQIVSYDLELGAESISESLYNEWKMMEPFGTANPRPVFRTNDVQFPKTETFGVYDMHTKCTIGGATFFSFFSKNEEMVDLNFHALDVLYSPLKRNEYTIESLRKKPFLSDFEDAFENILNTV